MATREAACHCGQLRLEVTGEPFAVGICNCLACQRRTGSAFGMQAGFKPDQVNVVGRYNDYSRISEEADRKEHVFHFCPDCGSQVFYTEPSEPDLIVVSVGSFADPSFPPGRYTHHGPRHLRSHGSALAHLDESERVLVSVRVDADHVVHQLCNHPIDPPASVRRVR